MPAAVSHDENWMPAVTAGKSLPLLLKIQAGSITSQHINADGITANLITSGIDRRSHRIAKMAIPSLGDGITVRTGPVPQNSPK